MSEGDVVLACWLKSCTAQGAMLVPVEQRVRVHKVWLTERTTAWLVASVARMCAA